MMPCDFMTRSTKFGETHFTHIMKKIGVNILVAFILLILKDTETPCVKYCKMLLER